MNEDSYSFEAYKVSPERLPVMVKNLREAKGLEYGLLSQTVLNSVAHHYGEEVANGVAEMIDQEGPEYASRYLDKLDGGIVMTDGGISEEQSDIITVIDRILENEDRIGTEGRNLGTFQG